MISRAALMLGLREAWLEAGVGVLLAEYRLPQPVEHDLLERLDSRHIEPDAPAAASILLPMAALAGASLVEDEEVEKLVAGLHF
jgi:hypothetical protein